MDCLQARAGEQLVHAAWCPQYACKFLERLASLASTADMLRDGELADVQAFANDMSPQQAGTIKRIQPIREICNYVATSAANNVREALASVLRRMVQVCSMLCILYCLH